MATDYRKYTRISIKFIGQVGNGHNPAGLNSLGHNPPDKISPRTKSSGCVQNKQNFPGHNRPDLLNVSQAWPAGSTQPWGRLDYLVSSVLNLNHLSALWICLLGDRGSGL